ncbi:MAG: MBL fold metallo-hydrolase [Oscillibacter sp.]|nr:MBL fold metallo-hydrolase [Oscillibacter sp.]
MKLTWLGHSCFILEADGYRLVTDPYADVAGYGDLSVQAHAIYCSHDHFDHNAVGRVTLLPARESPFTVREIETFHDEKGGALRGKNTVRVFEAGGVSVAHLGDLGHQLNDEQLRAIGKTDAVLVPVGGVYTVDAQGAKAVCDALAPRCIVPMHYRHAPYGLPNVAPAEDFLALYGDVKRLDTNAFELTADCCGVLVPKYLGNCA